MRPVLLHYHILKNGGSTIEEILRRSFRETFISFDREAGDAEIKNAELLAILEAHSRCSAFSSHQIFYPVPAVPGFLFFDICFLRDPIDRIRSIYEYFRGKPDLGNPMRELANRRPIGEFVRALIDEMPWTVNDVQVNLLANGIVNDQPASGDFDRANARMLETSFLGVVDRFNESLVAGEHALRVIFPSLDVAQSAVNEAARPGSTRDDRVEEFRAACGVEVFDQLLRLNQMDLELLRRARDEVRRRFQNVPDHDERLRRLKERMAGSAKTAAPEKSYRLQTYARMDPPRESTKAARWLRWMAHLPASRPKSPFRLLFDADFYRDAYPDVAASSVDPLKHFVTSGAFEGRDPHPLFDSSFYVSQLSQPPEINALCDYLDRGAHRNPHPLFDAAFYLARYQDVRKSGMNPLLHYVLHGAAEGRKPHPLFDPEYYRASCPAARGAENPLEYFITHERGDGRPHPLFDGDLGDIPPVAQAGALTILDVAIPVALSDSGEIAMWVDAAGRKQFRCPPQQRPFFECVRYDQVAAQVKGNPSSSNSPSAAAQPGPLPDAQS